ncbi:MAG: phosphoadenosine phosphosulfate reductase family protein [Ginsengibacter sp.]
MDKLKSAIHITKDYYLKDQNPWIVGFSGGKDSSLVIKILLTAIQEISPQNRKPIKIIYCDTGVEIPILRQYIKGTLSAVQSEGKELGIEIESLAITPKTEDLFFVKVIGRGYPPPTNKFRWCTDKLRIDPIQIAIKNLIGAASALVILGTRYEESNARNRILDKYSTPDTHIFNQSGHSKTRLFCPIVNFNTDEVWEGLIALSSIKSIDINKLSGIYKKISGECPIIRLPDLNPCSKGRFGCWTCTVVRQDKATRNLIGNGYISLQPLYDFRAWLLQIRDDTKYRCTVRRNGTQGLGPFRLSARKIILDKLLLAQKESGHDLISEAELLKINGLWNEDSYSKKYRENYL